MQYVVYLLLWQSCTIIIDPLGVIKLCIRGFVFEVEFTMYDQENSLFRVCTIKIGYKPVLVINTLLVILWDFFV